MRIEVCVSRGDVYLKTEAAPVDALPAARYLTLLARQLVAEAPELLPGPEAVPGDVLPYDWQEEYADGCVSKVPRVGFTR